MDRAEAVDGRGACPRGNVHFFARLNGSLQWAWPCPQSGDGGFLLLSGPFLANLSGRSEAETLGALVDPGARGEGCVVESHPEAIR